MGLYVLRRFINSLIIVSIATILGYVLASIGLDPKIRYLGRNPRPSDETIAKTLDSYGTNPDRPVLERLGHWLTGVVTRFDFGKEWSNESVVHDLGQRSVVSLQLVLIGSILGAVIGVSLGVWGAVRQYKASDQIITFISYLVLATPVFVLGVLLMILTTKMNSALGTDLQFTGQYTPGVSGFWPTLKDHLGHLILPTIALVLTSAASYSRYQRGMMLDVLSSDYIRTARSKGRTRTSALVRHGVRVALIPMSVFFAYNFTLMVTGATFLEIIFSWHGMGELSIQSIQQNDINATAGSIFYIGVLVLIASTLSEIMYAALDPRVRV